MPEIAGHGLEAEEKLDDILVHLLFELIDLIVVGDGRITKFLVAINEARKGVAKVAARRG